MTESTPKRSAARSISQRPKRKRLSRSARPTAAIEGSSSAIPGSCAPMSATATVTTATPTKATCSPTIEAKPPRTGPSSAPTIAAPSAVPRSSPRRLRGAEPISQASPPAQESALPRPWTKRAMPRPHALSAYANPTLGHAHDEQAQRARRAWRRSARRRSRPGCAPASTPIAYDATRSPAPVFERPNRSTKSGRSGVSAA